MVAKNLCLGDKFSLSDGVELSFVFHRPNLVFLKPSLWLYYTHHPPWATVGNHLCGNFDCDDLSELLCAYDYDHTCEHLHEESLGDHHWRRHLGEALAGESLTNDDDGAENNYDDSEDGDDDAVDEIIMMIVMMMTMLINMIMIMVTRE